MRALLARALLAAALAGGLAGCKKAGSCARTFAVPGHGALVMSLPEDWRTEVIQLHGDFPPTIVLSPAEGKAFQTRITVLWDRKSSPAFNTPDSVRKVMQQLLEKMLPTAVETAASLQEFKTADGAGFYYVLTDKAPRPGEFTHVLQAGAGVGDLFLSVTMLCRSKACAGIQDTLDALATAQQRSRAASPSRRTAGCSGRVSPAIPRCGRHRSRR